MTDNNHEITVSTFLRNSKPGVVTAKTYSTLAVFSSDSVAYFYGCDEVQQPQVSIFLRNSNDETNGPLLLMPLWFFNLFRRLSESK